MSNAAAVDRTALCSHAFARRSLDEARTMAPPVRLGLDTQPLDCVVVHIADRPSGRQSITARWSPALHAFLDILEEYGGERAFWADALDRVIDVMADTRRSYQETAVRSDPYLRNILGLQPAQLTALAALLVGTRRGRRAEQSLLRALHRDPGTRP